jgi:predicted nuclease with TOPRIM domain
MSLSERLRPGVEAADWVIKEVKRLEAHCDRMAKRIKKLADENARLHEGMDHYRNQLAKATKLAPGSGRVN